MGGIFSDAMAQWRFQEGILLDLILMMKLGDIQKDFDVSTTVAVLSCGPCNMLMWCKFYW